MSLFGSYNHVVIMGNLTRDIELRTLPSGQRVADVTIAVNESVKRGDKWEDETTFVDVTLWGKTAELVERFGGKGKSLLVDGRLRQEKWVDKASGQNRSKMKVVAENVTFPRGGDGDRGGGGGRPQSSAKPYDDQGESGGYGGGGAQRGRGAPARGAKPGGGQEKGGDGGYSTSFDEAEANYSSFADSDQGGNGGVPF